MIYYSNIINIPHMVFIGRWNPFHKGHSHIILEKYIKKNKPVLIMVRGTKEEINIFDRCEIIKIWMICNEIKGTIMLIPDICGIYYGRDVGYDVEEIIANENIRNISASEIREMIKDGNEWENYVNEETINFIRKKIW